MARSANISISSRARLTNAQLLVKNLRLLDVDEDFDWPEIDEDTFSAKSSTGITQVIDHDRRVYCATWVLSRLFAIYDADGKQMVIQNRDRHEMSLRDTLSTCTGFFKRLSEMKRSGIISADVSIRKASFDECEGVEFEELLAVFSSAVLIRATEQRENKCIVQQRMGRQRLDLDTRVLELAYRVSLTKHLSERTLLQKRWSKFSRAMELQGETLDRRAQRVESSSIPLEQHKRIPQRTINRLEGFLKEHWTGNQEWVGVLVRGGQASNGDLLDLPSSDVWQHACNDTLYAIRPQQDDNCLQALQNRAEEQKLRLAKWKAAAQAYRTTRNQQQHIAEPPRVPEKEGLPVKKYSLRSTRQTSTHRPSSSASSATLPVVSVVPGTDTESRKPVANTSKRLSSIARSLQSRNGQGIPVTSRRQSPQPLRKDGRKNDKLPAIQTEPVQSEKAVGSSNDDTAILDTTVLRKESDVQKVPLTLAERTKLSMANMTTSLDQTTAAAKKQQIRPLTSVAADTPAELKQNTSTEHTTQPASSQQQMVANQPGYQTPKPRVSAIYPPTKQIDTSSKENAGEVSFFDETTIDLDEVDIFKSRPKVAVSPILAPKTNGDVSMISLMAESTNDSSEDDFS